MDFSCRVRACARAEPRAAPTNRNVERTKKWRESRRRQQRHRPDPLNPSPPAAAPPAPEAVNGPAQATSTPAAARSFAEVAAVPACSTKATAIAKTVNAANRAAAGSKARKATAAHPKKIAKSTLAASRVSQRSALLSKKRAAAATNVPAASADEDEAVPELLRGSKGKARLNSLEISLAASPPPPPSPSPPSSPTSPPPPPLSPHNPCDCASPCKEKDYHDVEVEDGKRLSTRDPPWERVFPFYKSLRRCRFCKEPLPERDEEEVGEKNGDNGYDTDGDCTDCKELTTFTLIKKFAPRWRYPKS